MVELFWSALSLQKLEKMRPEDHCAHQLPSFSVVKIMLFWSDHCGILRQKKKQAWILFSKKKDEQTLEDSPLVHDVVQNNVKAKQVVAYLGISIDMLTID